MKQNSILVRNKSSGESSE